MGSSQGGSTAQERRDAPSAENSQPSAPAVSQWSLLKRFFFNDLVALQFGLDSTLWLPTVFSFIRTLKGDDAAYYLSIAQLLPAAVQLFVSLIIGPIVGYLGCSLKWPIVAFVLCSAAGNFIYSCAGVHAIGDVWALIGGRMLSALASGSSSLSMSYLAICTSAAERLPAFSLYRTLAGIALVLGPLLSVPLTTFTFHIGRYVINGDNAPTFVSAAIAFLVACVTAAALRDKKANKVDFLKVLAEEHASMFKGDTDKWLVPVLCLMLMFISSFLMANNLYFLSELLTAPDQWAFKLTLTSGLQAAVFAVSLAGSLGAETLRKWFGTWVGRYMQDKDRETESKDTTYTRTARSVTPEVVLCIASFAASVLALVLVIISLALVRKSGTTRGGTVVCFLIGSTLMMASYNVQASSLPSLYSKCIPAKLRVVLTPWYAATVAAGKLAGPPIIHALSRARATSERNGGWIGSQALCIGLSFVACFMLVRTRRSLVRVISLMNPP